MNGVTNLWLTIRACADLFLWGAIAILFVAAIVVEIYNTIKKKK